MCTGCGFHGLAHSSQFGRGGPGEHGSSPVDDDHPRDVSREVLLYR
jgi:hypothetical protein